MVASQPLFRLLFTFAAYCTVTFCECLASCDFVTAQEYMYLCDLSDTQTVWHGEVFIRHKLLFTTKFRFRQSPDLHVSHIQPIVPELRSPLIVEGIVN